MTKLIATKQFTDKQGQQRQANESFEARNDQEAQEYIKNGQARQAEDPSQTGSKR